MTPERFRQIIEIFHRVRELDGDDRSQAIAAECGDDLDLRKEVESLVWSHEAPEALLATDAVGDWAESAIDEDAVSSTQPSPAVLPDGGPRKVCRECRRSFPASAKVCTSDGSILVDDPASFVGQVLDGKYRLDALLGQGGMGVVYRATHLLLEATVALKVLPRELTTDPTWLAYFKSEGKALRAFSHPNVVRVWDLSIHDDGTAYLVMDFVAGETLRALLARPTRLPLAQVRDIVDQLASALDAAHARGVVHRDIKPENVIASVGAAGRVAVKLVDFGIAKLVGETAVDRPVTRPGANVGTAMYMAPEQWGCRSRDGNPAVDHRVDVFALGLLTCELLTGEPLLRGDSLTDFQRASEEIGLEISTRGLRHLDGHLARVIGRALARDRVDRPTTAGEFAAMFREAALRAESARGNVGTTVTRHRSPAPAGEAPSPYQLVAQLVVESHFGAGTIEFYWGDLTKPPPGFFFDTLVVSAFPGDHEPTDTALIGGLARHGISVAALAEKPWVDLRSVANCWVSRELTREETSLPIGRILCFEPPVEAPPGEHIGDIFRCLVAAFGEVDSAQTVAMPLVAAGDRGTPAHEIIPPLIETSVEWMRRGLPLRRLLVVARGRAQAFGLAKWVHSLKHLAEAPMSRRRLHPSGADVFVSHAIDDLPVATNIAERLRAVRPETSVRLGGMPRAGGSGWGSDSFDELDSSTIVVPLLSRPFLEAKACLEQYNAALYRHRASTDGVLYPLLVADVNVPPYVDTFGFMDCRDPKRIEVAARRLAAILDAREKM